MRERRTISRDKIGSFPRPERRPVERLSMPSSRVFRAVPIGHRSKITFRASNPENDGRYPRRGRVFGSPTQHAR